MKYSAKGYCWGHLWGGGQYGYATESITGISIENIQYKAQAMLKDGSLDSGMGFESLIGAVLEVTIIDTKIIKSKEYTHTDYEELIIGELAEDTIDLLRTRLLE